MQKIKHLAPYLILALLSVCFLFIAAATTRGQTRAIKPTRLAPINCQRPLWSSQCSLTGAPNCVFADPASGCDNQGDGHCEDCGMGLIAPGPLDPESSAAFYVWFKKPSQVVVSKSGPLSRYGVRVGDYIRTINKYRVTPARLAKWAHRKNPVMRFRVYRPESRTTIIFYARPQPEVR